MSPEKQFKNFLIFLVFIVAIICFFVAKPDFTMKSAVPLSDENILEDELIEDNSQTGEDLIVDIEIEEENFEFTPEKIDISDFAPNKNDEKYWVSGSIPIVPMSEYNYKTKNEIYKLRKNYVEKSMFKNRDYRPSEEVFGQIVDKKPWMSINSLTCTGKSEKSYLGLSEESRFINNPSMLVGIDRIQFDDKPVSKCSPIDYMMPVKLNYSKDENTITAVYELKGYQGNLKEFMLKGLNARDLGFKYAYVQDSDNIMFLKGSNISSKIYDFRDFIHLGSACGVNGGCNNGSPRQMELEFVPSKYPSWMFIKLWEKLPRDVADKSDINYLIIIN